MEVRTDAERGGRWVTLQSGDRSWLWQHGDERVRAQRLAVGPGDDFVDAGGVEECFPTVRGLPDHGAVWNRPWERDSSGGEGVGLPEGVLLRRTLSIEQGTTVVGYTITGPPGFRFLHAVHALLELSDAARLVVPGTRQTTPVDAGDVARPWPSGLDRFGPADGSAVCVLLADCREASVVDGDYALRFAWTADRPELCSLLLWRNLGGWPAGSPYRSIGVEPMIGRAAELAAARDRDVVELDDSGRFSWSLRVSVTRT